MDSENGNVTGTEVITEETSEEKVNSQNEEEMGMDVNVQSVDTPVMDVNVSKEVSHPNITAEQVANVSKQQFNKSKVMFLEFIKKPVTMMSGLEQTEDSITPLLFGALQVLLALIFGAIKMKSFKCGLLLACAVIVANLVTTGVIYIVGMIKSKKMDFVKILALFCIATIPGTMMFVLAFIFSFFWSSGAFLFISLGFLSWIMLGYHAANEYLPMDKDLVFWFYLVIVAIVLVFVYLIMKEVVSAYITNLIMGSLSAFM